MASGRLSLLTCANLALVNTKMWITHLLGVVLAWYYAPMWWALR
jgi:hypothetical protein